MKARISVAMIDSARRLVYILLGLAVFAPRWVVIQRQVGRVPVEFSSIIFYLSDPLLLLAVGLWLTGHLLDGQRRLRLDPWFITLPLTGLTVLTGLSAIWATSTALALEFFLRLCLLLAFYLLIRNEGIDPRRAALALVAGAVLHAPLAIAQFIFQYRLEWLLVSRLGAVQTWPWLRGYGLTAHANILGGYLDLGLAALLAMLLAGVDDRPGRKARAGLFLIFGIAVAGLLSTFSRSSWLGLAVGSGLLGIVWGVNRPVWQMWRGILGRLALIGGLTSLVFVIFWPGYFMSRLAIPAGVWPEKPESLSDSTEIINLETRAGYNQTARQLIIDRFPWGVGGANFSLASYLYAPDLPPDHLYLPVHNSLLLITAELGPVGGLLWLLLWAGLGLALWRSRAGLSRDSWWLGWSIALIALLVISFFDFYLWGWQFGRLMLWALLGLWAARYGQIFASPAYGTARLKVPSSSVSTES